MKYGIRVVDGVYGDGVNKPGKPTLKEARSDARWYLKCIMFVRYVVITKNGEDFERASKVRINGRTRVVFEKIVKEA